MKTKITNFKLIFGILLILFLIFLGADIIRDLLLLIFKDSLNKTTFTIIHFILIYILITLMFRTKPVKKIENEITRKLKKKKKTKNLK